VLTLFERPYTNQKARVRNISTKQVVKDINLKHGSLVSIEGKRQNEFQYEIPKTSAKISESIGKKITIIFSEVPPAEKTSP
jgi:alkylated DNA repair dioxygenase AlkB